jgi:hypothetical protein
MDLAYLQSTRTLLFCSSVVEARLGVRVGEVFGLWYGLQGCTVPLELPSSSSD